MIVNIEKEITKEHEILEVKKYSRKIFYKSDRIIKIIFASIKRITDILLALIGLIIFFPLMLIVAIAIKIDSKGPVLFKQERTGFHGKRFYLYKFRSMVYDNNVRDLRTEDQYTRVGKIIRKLSIDEFPQLINILKTEMSFIGPRPWIPEYYENMNEIQKHRCDVRPGLTGLAQAKGRNSISIQEKINYDLEYIKNYSLKQDIKIIFLTLVTVFTRKGAEAGKYTIKNELEELREERNKEKIKEEIIE